MIRLAIAIGCLCGCTDTFVEVLRGEPPTFYEDVAPGLASSCWCCHRPGGVGPSLVTPEEVGVHFDEVIESLVEETMPPLPAGPAPVEGCSTLARAAPAPRRELVTILAAWNERGRRPGDPANAPPRPAACNELRGEPIRIELPAHRLPAGTRVESICYRVPSAFAPGTAVVAVRRLSSVSTLRSMVLYSTVDAEVPEGGALCMDYEPGNADVLAGLWAGDDLVMPLGVGVPVGSADLGVAIVYDQAFAGGDLTPRPTVLEIFVEPSEGLDRRAAWIHGFTRDLALSADASSAASARLVPLSNASIHGVALSMHDFGSRLEARFSGPGRETCVLEHAEWKPNLVRPLFFDPALDGIATGEVACEYDLTGTTEIVRLGFPPAGETCLLSLLVSRP